MNYQPIDPYSTRAFAIWILQTEEGYTEADAKRMAIWDELMQAVGRRKCKQVGHKIVDQSSGGPESGTFAWYCSRCGKSHMEHLY